MNRLDAFIIFVCAVLVYLLIAPSGTTINSSDIIRTEALCENKGGVDSYNTWLHNTVYCEEGKELLIGAFWCKESEASDE